jgi:hypothetical protein
MAQALGAYGRLSRDPETSSFRKHMRPALGVLLRALDNVPPLPALRQAARYGLQWLA